MVLGDVMAWNTEVEAMAADPRSVLYSENKSNGAPWCVHPEVGTSRFHESRPPDMNSTTRKERERKESTRKEMSNVTLQ